MNPSGCSKEDTSSKLLQSSGKTDASIFEYAPDTRLGCDFVPPEDDVTVPGSLLNYEGKQRTDADDNAFDRGGYGWVVCVACFAGQFMFPLGLSYGLFNVVLLEQFGGTKMETALVGSVCYGLMQGMGVVSGTLANRLGHRMTCMIGSLLTTSGYIISAFSPNLGLLYFSYGVMTGTGVSMMTFTTSIMVNFYFKKYRNLAVGIMTSGAGVGYLVFPLMIEHFIETYSWRGAMVLLAGISFQGCVVGALLRPNERLKTFRARTEQPKTTLHLRLFRKWTFILLIFILFTYGISASIFFTICPHRVVTYGFSIEQGALLLFLTGIASLAARLFIGVVFQFFKYNTSIALGTAITGMAVAHLVLAFHHNQLWVLILVSVGFGLMFGLLAYSYTLCVVTFFGLERLNSAFGFIVTGNGLGGLLGPSLAGFLYDSTGDYQVAFSVASALAFIGGLLNIPMYFYMRRKLTHKIVID
ncbi:monocarboxylate transporter 13-like isoform X1 [Lineus longissimus]|uniref:monocarboxylate transporter 13-like isoform X1 n=1 Tax=Lineus longissimus TaxID=88925 RepID=UPI00315DF85A